MQGTCRLAAGVQSVLEPLAPPPALSSSGCAASALWVRCIPVPPSPLPCFPLCFLASVWSVPTYRANFSLKGPSPEVVPLPAPPGACGFHCTSIPFHPAAHSPGSPPWWRVSMFLLPVLSPHHLGCQEPPGISPPFLPPGQYFLNF